MGIRKSAVPLPFNIPPMSGIGPIRACGILLYESPIPNPQSRLSEKAK